MSSGLRTIHPYLRVLAGGGGVCKAPGAKVRCRKGQQASPAPASPQELREGWGMPHAMGWVFPPWSQHKVLGLAGRGHCLPILLPACSQYCILEP